MADISRLTSKIWLENLVRVRAARDQMLLSPLSNFLGAIALGEVALTVQTLGESEGRMRKQIIREWFGDKRLSEEWSRPVTTIGLLSTTTRITNWVADMVKKVSVSGTA